MGRFHGLKNSVQIIVVLLSLFLVSGCTIIKSPLAKTPPTTILVAITDPGNHEKYPVSGAVSVRAEVVSDDPIQKLELWVDGLMVNEFAVNNTITRYLAHTWEWESGKLGEHTITVRAFTNLGESGQSNILNLTSIQDPGVVVLYTTQLFDTLEAIAEKYGTSVFQILQYNPQLSETQKLPAGELIRIPVEASILSDESLQDSKMAQTNQVGVVTLVNFPIRRNLFNFLAGNATSPVISASVEGCSVKINLDTPSPKATGYNIYRLNQGGESFSKVSSISASGISTPAHQDNGLAAGQYQYYLASYVSGLFAASSENPSNIVSVSVTDSTCTGGVVTVEELLPNALGLAEVYLYLSLNDLGWIRFPQDQFTFMKSTQSISFGEMVNMVAPGMTGDVTLRGEGWGWDGGGLIFLGTFEKSILASPALASMAPASLAEFYKTELDVRGTAILDTNNYTWAFEKTISKYEPYPFRWGTNTEADSGLWQVSTQPFDALPSINPACLVLTDIVPPGTLQAKKEFTINFSSLAPKPLEATKDQTNPSVGGLVLFTGVPPVSPPYSPQASMGDPQNQPIINKPFTFDPCTPTVSPDGITTYYVRVLPMKNKQPLSSLSNTVVVKYNPEVVPPITINYAPTVPFYEVKILGFTELNNPDINFAYCVKVVKNPFFNSGLIYWGKIAPGTVVCPEKYKGGNTTILEDIGSFIEDAINYISDLYQKLSDYVTELVEKLNPFCIQAQFIASAVGEGEKEVTQVCHMAAVIVVAAAKTYVGLPPSLPNYDQLTGMGEDYLVEMAADEMEANGIPCPEDCKKLLKQGIDYSLEQVKKSFKSNSCIGEEEAHANGFEPLCPPPGVETIPDPHGQPAPPTTQIRVTRLAGSTGANIPQPSSCYVTLSGSAKNDSYVGKTVNLYFGQSTFSWQGASIEGSLISGGMPIPSLAAGQSVEIPLVLQPVPFWLPGHFKWYQQWINVPVYDDWAYLYQGGKMSLTAGGSCTFPGLTNNNFSHVQGETKSFGPLGDAYLQTCYPYCP